jgi:hypothetical protein
MHLGKLFKLFVMHDLIFQGPYLGSVTNSAAARQMADLSLDS